MLGPVLSLEDLASQPKSTFGVWATRLIRKTGGMSEMTMLKNTLQDIKWVLWTILIIIRCMKTKV